jgi:tripartite-type tricarboxylate transporter receptor subunit TctC
MVPYRGGAAALAASASGEANLIVNGATATQPFVQNGSLRGIACPARALGRHARPAVLRRTRLAGGGERHVAGRAAAGRDAGADGGALGAEMRALLARPEMARRVSDLGGEVRTDGAAAFRAWLERETENWGRVVRAANIKLD